MDRRNVWSDASMSSSSEDIVSYSVGFELRSLTTVFRPGGGGPS